MNSTITADEPSDDLEVFLHCQLLPIPIRSKMNSIVHIREVQTLTRRIDDLVSIFFPQMSSALDNNLTTINNQFHNRKQKATNQRYAVNNHLLQQKHNQDQITSNLYVYGYQLSELNNGRSSKSLSGQSQTNKLKTSQTNKLKTSKVKNNYLHKSQSKSRSISYKQQTGSPKSQSKPSSPKSTSRQSDLKSIAYTTKTFTTTQSYKQFLSPIYQELQLTEQCDYSLTPYVISRFICKQADKLMRTDQKSKHINNTRKDAVAMNTYCVIDAFAGCGGDAIVFGSSDQVTCIRSFDINETHLRYLLYNAAQYDAFLRSIVPITTKIQIILKSAEYSHQYVNKTENTLVYLDPPFALFKQRNLSGFTAFNLVNLMRFFLLSNTNSFILKLPKYINVNQVKQELQSIQQPTKMNIIRIIMPSKREAVKTSGFFIFIVQY